MPITGDVSPRIRIFLLTLLAALAIAPAQASAANSACGNDLAPYALATQDQTVVSNSTKAGYDTASWNGRICVAQ